MTFSPSPRPTDNPRQPYTEWERTLVDDRPTENCAAHTTTDDAQDVICVRVIPPAQVPSGTPADLVLEVCSRAGDVELTFDGQETDVYVYDGANEVRWRARPRPAGEGPHDVTVPLGKCLRYTFHWDGLDADRRPLERGTYNLYGTVYSGGGATVDNAQPQPFQVT